MHKENEIAVIIQELKKKMRKKIKGEKRTQRRNMKQL